LIELFSDQVYHIKGARRAIYVRFSVDRHIKKIPIPTASALRAAGRHIKLDFLEIPNSTANWPIGDLADLKLTRRA
jgi:hypothetical protein